MENTKVAIYIRGSTEDQAKEAYSLEVQRECLGSFAEREDLEVFKLYQDDDISGYPMERVIIKTQKRKFDLVCSLICKKAFVRTFGRQMNEVVSKLMGIFLERKFY